MSEATRRGMEIANHMIREAGRTARDAPMIVAEELGLVQRHTVRWDSAVIMQLPRDTGVRLRIRDNMLALAMVRHRRRWQFWRPPVWLETLTEKPYIPRVNDTVELMQTGMFYTATVNDKVVLTWPVERPSRSMGMGIR